MTSTSKKAVAAAKTESTPPPDRDTAVPIKRKSRNKKAVAQKQTYEANHSKNMNQQGMISAKSQKKSTKAKTDTKQQATQQIAGVSHTIQSLEGTSNVATKRKKKKKKKSGGKKEKAPQEKHEKQTTYEKQTSSRMSEQKTKKSKEKKETNLQEKKENIETESEQGKRTKKEGYAKALLIIGIRRGAYLVPHVNILLVFRGDEKPTRRKERIQAAEIRAAEIRACSQEDQYWALERFGREVAQKAAGSSKRCRNEMREDRTWDNYSMLPPHILTQQC